MRIAFYSHDTMGLGHIRRNLSIAKSLAGSIDVSILLISGTREACFFDLPGKCECLCLPSLEKNLGGHYQSRRLDFSLKELLALRSATIRAALQSFAPDVFIVDKAPRGVLGELDSSLEMLWSRGNTRCVLGIRDVLDEPDRVDNEWQSEDNVAAANRYYDTVWVYGDPGVYDTIKTCRSLSQLHADVFFTGYLCPRGSADRIVNARPVEDGSALCLVGGGQDGIALARAFATCSLGRRTGTIVTGPFMAREAIREVEQFAADNVALRVVRFVPDLTPLIDRASHIIAMGGYNTICELLGSEKHVLIVPRVIPRREQAIRADRLRAMGVLDSIEPAKLDADYLTGWLDSGAIRENARGVNIDLDGLRRLPGLLRSVASQPISRGQAVA
jgi:predicted glycosyltransferase